MSHNWLHTPDCKVLNEIQVSAGVFTTVGLERTSREGLGCTKLHGLYHLGAGAQTCFATR